MASSKDHPRPLAAEDGPDQGGAPPVALVRSPDACVCWPDPDVPEVPCLLHFGILEPGAQATVRERVGVLERGPRSRRP